MDNPRGFIPHYRSSSIKIDAPPYEAIAPVTAAQFKDFPDEDPRAEATNQVYVLVRNRGPNDAANVTVRSEEHTSELQSLMRSSYAVFCLKKKNKKTNIQYNNTINN